MSWSRRDLFGAGLAGAGWLTLGGVPASALHDAWGLTSSDPAPTTSSRRRCLDPCAASANAGSASL